MVAFCWRAGSLQLVCGLPDLCGFLFTHVGTELKSTPGETNSGAQKGNIAIPVCCFCPIIVAGVRSVCALVCSMPQMGENQGK